jgi:hypothetical protein
MTGRWVSLGTPVSSTQKKITLRHGWNIGESGVKYHNPKDFLDIKETTERLEIQITEKSFGKKKSKVPKQDSQNQLWSPMPEGGEP